MIIISKTENPEKYFAKDRIVTLVDGIFAIAMTILVLILTVPEINPPVTDAALQAALVKLVPLVTSMVLSFILLALFWNIHHRIYTKIKSVHGPLLWVNLIWLLFIVLMPFSANLNGSYGHLTTSSAIFNINMIGISSLLYLNLHMITHDNFLHGKEDLESLESSKKSTLIFLMISIIAFILSFITPGYSTLIYILIIPFELRDHVFKNRINIHN